MNYIDSAGAVRGYERTTSGAFTTIDASGATGTNAISINTSGEITGNVYIANSAPPEVGFVRAVGSAITNFSVPGGFNTYAVSISDTGNIAGYFDTSVPGPVMAFCEFHELDPRSESAGLSQHRSVALLRAA